MVQKIATYRRGIGAFIASDKGQRFFNFAYSIGAAVVIWGALFKILHLPGGNTLLSLGMGTEVLMFLLTAFDRPPREYQWEKVYPALGHDEQSAPGAAAAPAGTTPAAGTAPAGVLASAASLSPAQTESLQDSIARLATASEQLSRIADVAQATEAYLQGISALAADMQSLHTTTAALNEVSSTLLQSYGAITGNSAAISAASEGYAAQMTELHRNISGLNTIYELQLRSLSGQIESIDGVNRGIKDIRDMYQKSATQSARYCEEAERMARYMQQLNSVYEKMLTAMTVNMYRPGANGLDGVPVRPEHHAAPAAAGRPEAQGAPAAKAQ